MTPFDIAIALAVDAALRQLHSPPPPPPPAPVVEVVDARPEPADPLDVSYTPAYSPDGTATYVETYPTPEPEPLPVEQMPVEPMPFLAYECEALDNDGNPLGFPMTIGIGGWVGDDLTGQDPWAPVRGRDDCVGVEGYETPGIDR